jgi:SAM-dependent methyltransferase
MSVFCHYANYYDLLYEDKDYKSEAKHVNEVLKKCMCEIQSILELGCGTGAHAVHLIRSGYTIHGVDLSEAMLTRAERNKKNLDSSLSRRLSFSKGDIRDVRLEDTYDAVIALFHVISYLPNNEDIMAVLSTARSHLKKGGIFLFDCWYGPAVLSQQPEVREKRFENDRFRILRVAEPKMIANANIVEVNYRLSVEEKANGRIEKIEETHRMRYFFKPEIEMFLSLAGFQLVEFFEWMTGLEPGLNTWNVCFVGKS